MDTTTETTDLVCMMHNLHWPCKKLKKGDREHWWAYQTITGVYMERVDKSGSGG